MKHYLIEVTIGPVQDFIASARKLRDLWFGSDLLSELSKTIARSLHQQGAELVFPSIDDETDLSKNSQLIVANKILVQITTQEHPDTVIKKARADWTKHWQEIIEVSLAEIHKKPSVSKNVNEKVYRQQLNDFGEFYAVWVETTDDNQGYHQAKQALDKIMSARKSVRLFSAPTWNGEGIPKSSLDGIKEAVIGDGLAEIKGLVKKNERLDALACVKRFYPLNPGISRKRRQFDDLESIASSSYRNAILNSFGDDNDQDPNKYACILLGDGDHMGKAIDAIKNKKGHQVFSRELGKFAENVKETIEDHQGSLIYAGGDDVMAYVPLFSAIQCADEIRKNFAATMREIFKQLKLSSTPPTFSIGLATVHHSEPLSNALNLARQAEQIAKQQGGRNALAVVQHKRGGSDLVVYGKWQEGEKQGIAQRLQLMADLHEAKILPSTLGYQLRQVRVDSGDEMDFAINADNLVANNATAALVQRILQQKDKAEELKPKLLSILEHQKSVRQLSDEMVIAKQFSEDQKIYNAVGVSG
jgi:CRISPR-associated protein Cmr2